MLPEIPYISIAMQYYTITRAEDIGRSAWSDYVRNHPDGYIFQTPEFYDIYCESKKCFPSVVCLFDQEERICSLLLGYRRREHNGILGLFSRRSILIGGPLIPDGSPGIWRATLEAYERMINGRVIYTQFRNLFHTLDFKDEFESHGYLHVPHLTVLIDLRKSEEELWKDLHTKRRNVIRKARKEKVVVREFDDKDTLIESYGILEKVYQRVKLPFPEFEFFEGADKILRPKGMIRYFGAFYEGKLIGMLYMLAYKNKMYAWYLGSHAEYLSKHPNSLLFWEVFLIAKSEGYEKVDLAGAGNPNEPYGVRDFKQKFGGEIVDYGRYQKVHQPVLMKTGVIGLKMYQKWLEWGHRKVIPCR